MKWTEAQINRFIAETKIEGTVENTLRKAALRIGRAYGRQLDGEVAEDLFMKTFVDIMLAD